MTTNCHVERDDHPGIPHSFSAKTDSKFRSLTAGWRGIAIQHNVPGDGPLKVAPGSQLPGGKLMSDVLYSSESSLEIHHGLVRS